MKNEATLPERYKGSAGESNGINLDCCAMDEYQEFREWVRTTGERNAAKLLFPDHPRGRVTAVASLVNYSWNAQIAREQRLKGDIQTATIYEHAAQLCYDRLPDWARAW